MTKHNNMQIVREKVIEANPSIMDLVFGCVIDVHGTQRTIIGLTHDQKGFMTLMEDITFIVSKESMEYSKIIEIIGRPITLADVLVALPDSIFINTKGEIWSNKATEETDATWNLLKPLEEQSEEVITMLANLLK